MQEDAGAKRDTGNKKAGKLVSSSIASANKAPPTPVATPTKPSLVAKTKPKATPKVSFENVKKSSGATGKKVSDATKSKPATPKASASYMKKSTAAADTPTTSRSRLNRIILRIAHLWKASQQTSPSNMRTASTGSRPVSFHDKSTNAEPIELSDDEDDVASKAVTTSVTVPESY